MGMLPFRCCCGAGYWDFTGWENSGNADVSNGRILARMASSFDSGVEQSSHPSWSIDIDDFNGASGEVEVWITHGTHDPAGGKKQRFWYYITKGDYDVDGNARIEVIDAPYNGTPTNVDTYTVDWTKASGTPRPEERPRSLCISWDSKLRVTAHTDATPSPQFYDLLKQSPGGGLYHERDLSDMSLLSWHDDIQASANTLAAREVCSVNRQTYLSGDYRPQCAARYNADKALGYRLTVEVNDTVWEWTEAGGYWFYADAPEISSYELKVVLGDLTATDGDSTVTDDLVIYTLTGYSLTDLASEGNQPTDLTTEYEVEAVSCVSLEVVDDTPLGIFYYTDKATGWVIGRTNSFPGPPSDGQQHTSSSVWVDQSFPGDFSNTGPQPGAVTRIDILLPTGSVQSTGITSLSGSDIPITARHALGSDGSPNGNFFMVTSNTGFTTQQQVAGKLKYMSDATTEIWSKSGFDLIGVDICVSDRFVYIVAKKSTESETKGYAYDYAGNEYELQHPSSTLPMPVKDIDVLGAPTQIFDYFTEAWAVYRYADNYYPTTAYLAGVGA